MYELHPSAAAKLSQPADEPDWAGPGRGAPPEAPQLRSLFEFLGEVQECRHARGQRYSSQTVLVLTVAARLAGYRGVTAFAQFAALLEQRQAVECFNSSSRQCYTSPSITTFHNTLANLPPDMLEEAVAAWNQHQGVEVQQEEADPGEQVGLPTICMDGKDVRGASKQSESGRRMLVAAVEQGSGVVLGQLEIDSKTNEIPALRELGGGLELIGRVVTANALHSQLETPRCLVEDCGADYLITAIKDNQPTMLEDLRGMDFSACPSCATLDKQHGRLEQRRYWVKEISGEAWNGYANLYRRQQPIRIERQRQVLKSGETSVEVSYALTSLGPEQATPEQLGEMVRNHWHIENRLHYVRDFAYDEDGCRRVCAICRGIWPT